MHLHTIVVWATAFTAVTASFQLTAWKAPGPSDERSPCPALNILANHGYIPHDGKNIVFSKLETVMLEVYSLKASIYLLFRAGATITGATDLPSLGTFSLGNLADTHYTPIHQAVHAVTAGKINLPQWPIIAHNASLAHPDIPFGAKQTSMKPDPVILQGTLELAPKGFTFEAFAQARAHAKQRSEADGSLPLNNVADTTALGEAVLAHHVLSQNGVVSVERMKSFYENEKLPEGYQPPASELNLLTLNSQVNKMRGLMKSVGVSGSSTAVAGSAATSGVRNTKSGKSRLPRGYY